MKLTDAAATVRDNAAGVVAIGRTGAVRPMGPRRAVELVRRARGWGVSVATGVIVSAVRDPGGTALVDADGTRLDWATLDERTNAMARALAERGGVEAGDAVGVLCRNHRGFVEATLAASKLGAHTILLNTGFSAPQLRDVAAREGVVTLLHDADLAAVAAESGAAGGRRFLAGAPSPELGNPDVPTLDGLVADHDGSPMAPPASVSTAVILTSGTTGTPKGARRHVALSLGTNGPLALVSRIPLRARRPSVISAPMFHAWGFGHFGASLALGAPMVLAPRFDPEAVLAAIEAHRADTLVVVPVMVQRLAALPDEVRRRYDLSSLRVVACSGSALPKGLAHRFMDGYGDVLYSLYGSTEVAWAAIAGPEHLRVDPDSAGPMVADIRILDEAGRPVPEGATGRIFVRNPMLFEGYTGGGGKEVLDGYMSSGDVGHVDAHGWLTVDGRDDDMIVSGGENVFPQEVEGVIMQRPGVADAACVGVPDDEFGQRLVAFVVRGPGPEGDGLDDAAVVAWVRDHLARFKVPRDVRFVDELPRTTTGKVLRRVLAEQAGGTTAS